MFSKNLNAQQGFSPAALAPPKLRYHLNRYYIIIALERRGGEGEQVLSPPSPYLCFLFFLLIKGILQSLSLDVMHILNSMGCSIEHKD
jgi:hypothetical protein